MPRSAHSATHLPCALQTLISIVSLQSESPGAQSQQRSPVTLPAHGRYGAAPPSASHTDASSVH